MDCCGPVEQKEKDGDANKSQNEDRTGVSKDPVPKEQHHGCCGGGGTKGMWLHLALMIIVFIILSFILRR